MCFFFFFLPSDSDDIIISRSIMAAKLKQTLSAEVLSCSCGTVSKSGPDCTECALPGERGTRA